MINLNEIAFIDTDGFDYNDGECLVRFDTVMYECPNCGEKFVPSMKDFIFGTHTFTKRKLRCPKCGKKSFCRKRLS